jgi:NAD(P)-dependent dehydrogenase (short-subunit alcohol dehydrogenase family)
VPALTLPRRPIPVWGDLSDLNQVHALASQVLKVTPALDGMILNAGVFQPGGQTSSDGYELDFAVNYLSHLLLLHALLDRLHSAPEARVLFVSSSAYINGRVDLAHLGSQHIHDPLLAYATSKLLCLMAALELARRLSGSRICVNACNPGPTRTPLLDAGKRHGWRASGGSPLKAAHRLGWLALSPELHAVRGRYFNDRRTPNVPQRIRDPAATATAYEASMQLVSAWSRPLLATD